MRKEGQIKIRDLGRWGKSGSGWGVLSGGVIWEWVRGGWCWGGRGGDSLLFAHTLWFLSHWVELVSPQWFGLFRW